MRRFVVPVFGAGLLAGILIMYIGKGILLEDTGFFDTYTLCRIKLMEIDRNALFYFVFRKRVFALIVMAVLVTTYLGMAVCVGRVFWYGMSAGVFLCTMLLRYGVKGGLLAAGCLLPQYLLYVPAMLLFLRWAEEVYRGIYSRGSVMGGGSRGVPAKKMWQLAGIFGMITAGCLLEGYLNPGVLMTLLKIF